MAKKKEQPAPKGAPGWMATFSDLMNLLLCFFVLLFSMSSVDAEKWNEVVNSMQSSFSIFQGGYSSIGDGLLISAGTSQLNNLDEYFQEMGQTSEDNPGEDIHHNPSEEESLEEQMYKANKAESEKILDDITEKIDGENIGDYIGAKLDASGKYVELTIGGAFLFKSGKADIIDDAVPLLSKLGDILKVYDKYLIEIIGHTDNVPQTNPEFKNNDYLSSARAISVKDYLVDVKGLSVESMKWSGKGEYFPIASNATAEGRARNRRVEIRIYNSLNSD